MKRAEFFNPDYLLLHADEIINNTSALLPQWFFLCIEYDEDPKFRDIWKRMFQKHQVESGNWNIFGRGDIWISPGETWDEAEDRIVREYCEATGHWGLFVWEEVKEE